MIRLLIASVLLTSSFVISVSCSAIQHEKRVDHKENHSSDLHEENHSSDLNKENKKSNFIKRNDIYDPCRFILNDIITKRVSTKYYYVKVKNCPSIDHDYLTSSYKDKVFFTNLNYDLIEEDKRSTLVKLDISCRNLSDSKWEVVVKTNRDGAFLDKVFIVNKAKTGEMKIESTNILRM